MTSSAEHLEVLIQVMAIPNWLLPPFFYCALPFFWDAQGNIIRYPESFHLWIIDPTKTCFLSPLSLLLLKAFNPKYSLNIGNLAGTPDVKAELQGTFSVFTCVCMCIQTHILPDTFLCTDVY